MTDDVGRGVQSMSMKRFEVGFRFILGDLEGICKECVQGVVKEAVSTEDDDVDVRREVLGRGWVVVCR